MPKPSQQPLVWKQNLQSNLRVQFETDPAVHTYLSMAPYGMVGDAIRTAILYYLEHSGHPANNPEFQREFASNALAQMLQSMSNKTETSPVAATQSPTRPPISSPPTGLGPIPNPAPMSRMVKTMLGEGKT